MNTTSLSLPYLAAGQAQKHVTVNEALRRLDALVHLSVASATLQTPPASPAEGIRYIIPASANGVWAGRADRVAAFQDGAWAFFDPGIGWLAFVQDMPGLLYYSGTGWAQLPSSATSASMLGVNATADATNRLAVASAASLFNHQGAGHSLKINKFDLGSVASVIFQTAFSGRAELGLSGDDRFRLKVSNDGSTWRDAIAVDPDTGAVQMPLSPGVIAKIYASTAAWTKPDGLRKALAIVVGGGGGGGGVVGNGADAVGGGGGGGGGIAVSLLDAAALGSSLSVTVGGGGTAGTGSPLNSGGSGGASSFGTLLSATGGGGGTSRAANSSPPAADPGTGGVGANGNLWSGTGASGTSWSFPVADPISGTGGGSWLGAGGSGRTAPSSVAINGNSAISPGGGGGGACVRGATSAAAQGGVGKSGLVMVLELI